MAWKKTKAPPQISEVDPAGVESQGNGADSLTLVFRGRLDAAGAAAIWNASFSPVQKAKPRELILDAAAVDYCDGSGISLFFSLKLHQHRAGRKFALTGLKKEYETLLNLLDPDEYDKTALAPPQKQRLPEEVGRASVQIWEDQKALISFIGELTVGLWRAALSPRKIRWKDVFLTAEKTGVNALPIVALVSFLVGLIMAFQAAIPMRMFGAEIYVANLIALSMIRELGPLMTAIVLAGRSGSAFAAEIGAMKVNEEINALTTMGLDPLRFLVVTRVLAATAMTPLLTVFSDLVGVLGGSVVLLSMGYPMVTYVHQVLGAVNYVDFLGGILKSFVFGVIIAGIGCLRGLQTQTGPSAVGDSTTRAVVTCIVLIVVVDGIFSVIFYYLGI
ncbi:MAG: MlaE family lipid ABC transporter permease subunit [Pseudomonadota bacterium]